MVRTEELTFTAADGYRLSGTLFAPERPRYGGLVSSGTGFPRTAYRRFAQAWAEQRGAAVLVFDYRGIAGSAPPDLRGSPIEYTNWGRLDMPAAVETLAKEVGELPLVHAAHSVGGHFLGFMPNHARLARHAFLAVGTGYWGRHHLRNRPAELFFWGLYGPACLARYGYIPGGGVWGGTALPKGVFTTWRRWCLKPDYFESELRTRLRPHAFDEIRAPIRSWVFTDDGIATPRTGADLLRVYPNAPSELLVRRPADYGVPRIGHDGALRRPGEGLWPEIWDWLELDMEPRPA
jgi:predicted alpha/beta hydrolase